MAPPKKAQKMSLGNFLADDSLGGSWADEMEDFPPMPAEPRSSGYGTQRREYSSAAPSAGASSGDRFAGYSRTTDDHFSNRQQLPIPDKPPYTAHIGNLSFDATEAEIEDFFTGCEVSNVRLVRDRVEDRPKGFGYVEFSTKEGLIKALDLNGSQLAGRNVRISVAEPPKERQESRFDGEWRRSGPLPDLPASNRRAGYERSESHRSDRGDREERGHERESRARPDLSWERKGPLSPLPATTPGSEQGDRPGYRRRSPAPGAEGRGFRGERPGVERQPSAAESESQWRRAAPVQRSNPTSPVIPHTRPKLDLKKRSEAPVDVTAPASTSSDKPNPFGAAKPIDTLKREKEVEEKRAQLAAERKAAEEKAREEKKAAAAAAAAAAETEGKAAEAATPTTEKKFETLRRGSGPPEAVTDATAKPAVTEEKKVEKARTPDNWRARAPPKEPVRRQSHQQNRQQDVRQQQQQPAAQDKEEQPATPATEEPQDDGWNTVVKSKKGRGRA